MLRLFVKCVLIALLLGRCKLAHLERQFRLTNRFIIFLFLIFPIHSHSQSSETPYMDAYGARFSPVRHKIQNGFYSKAMIVLKIENITNQDGGNGNDIFVSAVFRGSLPISDLLDSNGCKINDDETNRSKSISGLSAGGNDLNNWVKIRPGGSVPVAYFFECYHIKTGIVAPLVFTATIDIFNSNKNPKNSNRAQIFFDDIR